MPDSAWLAYLGWKARGSGQDDICEYPLARSLSMLTVAITCEVIVRWLSTGRQESYSLTLNDFGVRSYPLDSFSQGNLREADGAASG